MLKGGIKMALATEISEAQWEIMRLLWSFKQATSSQIHEQLQVKCNWKIATTKTLLHRLVEKNFVGVKKSGRAYLYYPLISEHTATTQLLENDLAKICQKCRGQVLIEALNDLPLTRDDITHLQALLDKKKQTAPEKLACNCLPDICRCQPK